MDGMQTPQVDERIITVVRKVMERKPLTSEEVSLARMIGFSYDRIYQYEVDGDQERTSVSPKQLLHVIIKDVKTNEYVFDMGVVIDVFDQFILVHLEKSNRSISIRPEQIVTEYRQESSIECMIVTKNKKPVFVEERIMSMSSNRDEKSSRLKALLFGAACLSCPILCVLSDYLFG